MLFRVLGGDGGVAVGFQTTSFLINHDILIDAGSCATSLETPEQEKINHIFISHCHLDHVKDLCFLADNVFSTRRTPIRVISIPENLELLQKHVFNNKIWPDFSKISNGHTKLIEWVPLEGKMTIDKVTIEAVPVNHPVPAVGFLISDAKGTILVSGDTGPTEALWKAGHKAKNLQAIFTEIAFPDNHGKVAEVAGHFTPSMFAQEMKKLPPDVPIYIYHLKPSFYKALKQEIGELELSRLHFLELGAMLEF